MIHPSQEMVKNKLLLALSAEDYALIRPFLSPLRLDKRTVLIEADQLITYAFFPDTGIGSIVAKSPEGHLSEVGIFGHEGMAGSSLLLGVDRTPHQAIMQVGGAGSMIAAPDLVRLSDDCRPLRELLLRYVQVMTVQTAFTALSNSTHAVEERLARWLLMSHDRSEGDEIALTHDFLALMLGVRRPSVTTTLHILEGLGFIRSRRALVTILDRAGLEELAADAYGKPEAEYERIIGPVRHPSSPAASARNVHQLHPGKS